MHDNLDYVRARVSYPLRRPRPARRIHLALLALSAVHLHGVVCHHGPVHRSLRLGHALAHDATPRHLVRASILLVLGVACGFFWIVLQNDNDWQDQQPLVVIREDGLPLHKGTGRATRPMPIYRYYREAWKQGDYTSAAAGCRSNLPAAKPAGWKNRRCWSPGHDFGGLVFSSPFVYNQVWGRFPTGLNTGRLETGPT